MKTPAHTRREPADGTSAGQSAKAITDTLRGYATISVVARDNQEYPLEVLDIPLLEIDALAKVWGNLPKEVELYLGPGLAKLGIEFNDLTPASQTAAVKEGRRINRPTYQAWLEFQQETIEAMGPEAKKIYEGLLARAGESPLPPASQETKT